MNRSLGFSETVSERKEEPFLEFEGDLSELAERIIHEGLTPEQFVRLQDLRRAKRARYDAWLHHKNNFWTWNGYCEGYIPYQTPYSKHTRKKERE